MHHNRKLDGLLPSPVTPAYFQYGTHSVDVAMLALLLHCDKSLNHCDKSLKYRIVFHCEPKCENFKFDPFDTEHRTKMAINLAL